MVCGGTIGFSIGVCSGNGVCVNSSCVCSGTYSGRNPYFDVGDDDCLTSTLAIQILLAISTTAYLMRIMMAIAIAIKVPCKDLVTHKTVPLHLCLWTLSGIFGSIFSLLLCVGYYITDSWATLVFSECCGIISFLLASLNGTIMFKAYQKIPGVSQKTRAFSVIYFLVGLFGLTIMMASLLAIRLIPNGSIQIIIMRVHICTLIVQCFTWQFFVNYFAGLIYNIIKRSPEPLTTQRFITKLSQFKKSTLIINTTANLCLCILVIFPQVFSYLLGPLELLTTLLNYEIYQRYKDKYWKGNTVQPAKM
eukprot:TRINITY_DN7570_c0_g3_i1.p1 TRINITY_DN7570_c0_g3~~TRINITY_DN7570_c0_g3_i1.p1  ORF type:complete len:306 (+),score=64.11 TRINITY_DN7570_c0_g3_i1:19-936(+)